MQSFKPWDQTGFSIRLRGALFIRKFTQTELARALGLNHATVSRWQRSKSNYPGLDHLEAAAEFLNVDPGWLAFGTGTPPPEFAVLLDPPKIPRKTLRHLRNIQSKK